MDILVIEGTCETWLGLHTPGCLAYHWCGLRLSVLLPNQVFFVCVGGGLLFFPHSSSSGVGSCLSHMIDARHSPPQRKSRKKAGDP